MNSLIRSNFFCRLRLPVNSYCCFRTNQCTVYAAGAFVFNQLHKPVTFLVELCRETKSILRAGDNAKLAALAYHSINFYGSFYHSVFRVVITFLFKPKNQHICHRISAYLAYNVLKMLDDFHIQEDRILGDSYFREGKKYVISNY